MRIRTLGIDNFKRFAHLEFGLHPQFTLLVGENGAGKTSLLDALAVSLGIWLVHPPDTLVRNSGRNILRTEVRLEPSLEGDRIQFREQFPVIVFSLGQIGPVESVAWERVLGSGGRTSSAGSKQALDIIGDMYKRDAAGEHVVLPVLAYYGAGRAWLPSNQRIQKDTKLHGPARRWAAFYDCFNERIRFGDLNEWFRREVTASASRKGRMRPGFEVVRRAVLGCVDGADDVWFDSDLDQIVLSIGGEAQPFDNLSAGQRMMFALVADLAIKAVTQNAFLLPPDELGPEDEPLPRLLRETPGVVLIDELDVHLHPRWQRRVAADLKRTFPAIQFVCTSHSPQVIGELKREEVRLLGAEGVTLPPVAFGADSNWILDHVMTGATSETKASRTLQRDVEDALAEGHLEAARGKLRELRALLDGETGELVRLESSLETLEALAEEGDDEGTGRADD
ncbi:AAA family ATPase [Polyangium fumosum]|uniref:ATP-binding protein n=1 Tax=Polyangium fumosum TaxID=889272 RepID=A0A4U1JIN4_9BACT|nr:AAA family ATPase [Polyangium fumosum]TKD12374.1 ATP-binding protein [Polyangium fumosum]